MPEALDGKAADRVVIVPAASALKEYRDHSVYMCLPHRFFRRSVRMAFYTNNKIDRYIPKILSQIESISPDEIESKADLSENQRASKVTNIGQKPGSQKNRRMEKMEIQDYFPDTNRLTRDA